MQVGSLVECVDDKGFVGPPPFVQKGLLYTVRKLTGWRGSPRGLMPGILVEEVHRPTAPDGNEWGFINQRFREVQPPMEIKLSEIISIPRSC